MAIVAAIQMTSTSNVDENLKQAANLLSNAARQGAKLAVLPEMFPFMGGMSGETLKISEKPGIGKIQDFLSQSANKYNLWLVGGTIPLISEDRNKIRASCLIFDNNGTEVARYDKINLFDASVSETEHYKESDTTEAGNSIVIFDTPVGKMGVCVCYDIRFPLLLDKLRAKGAEVIAVPAAFTVPTGKSHWQLLARTRAVDTFCYIIGACQSGRHSEARETYGHSMIVDPWGSIIAEQIAKGPGVIVADINLEYLYQVRRRFFMFN